jgi:mono/diheme cytochrome c family protein
MRIALRIALGLAVFVLLVAGSVYGLTERRLDATFKVAPWKGKAPAASSEVLAAGAHVAAVRGCLDCHREDGRGGLFADAMPVMRLVPQNITPLGITKSYTDADWERAIRHCVRPDGHGIPFMPCVDNARLSDEDLGVLITYLRSLEPIAQDNEQTVMGPLGRVLFLAGQLPYLNAELIDHAASQHIAPKAGPTAAYGAYLGDTCAGCHGTKLSGGPIPGVPPEWPQAANLTPHDTGLKGWTKDQFLTALQKGVRPDGRKLNPQYMPWKQFAKFSPDEASALWLHLQTLSPLQKGGR